MRRLDYRIKSAVFFAAYQIYLEEAAKLCESECCPLVDEIARRQLESRLKDIATTIFDEEYLRGLCDGYDSASLQGARYKQGIADGAAIAHKAIETLDSGEVQSALWNVIALVAEVIHKEYPVQPWDGRKGSFLVAAQSALNDTSGSND